MNKRKTVKSGFERNPVRYSPISAPDRIVPLTAREIEVLIVALRRDWEIAQCRIVEFASGDQGVSARAARRHVEELDILIEKLGGHR